MSARVAVRQHSSSSSLTSFSILSRSLPPVPPPVVPTLPDNDCSRDKEDEIYITSASVIELDSRKSTDNDSYDSGIYNASTHTGWSSCSDKSSRHPRKQSPTAATNNSNTFLKIVSQDIDDKDYEEQVISVWLDFYNEDYSSEDEEESVYETLSDSAPHTIDTRQDDAYDDAKQEDSNLTKIAEAAGRGFKKLRRNWSIKKEDLTKGFSKIKRSSKNLIEDVYTKEVKFSSVGRRKLSMSQLLSSADITNSHNNHHHLQTNIQVQPPESGSQFYVGFSEAYKPGQFSRSGSVLSDISESDIITDFSPPVSLSSVSSIPASLASSTPRSSSISAVPVRPRRRSGKSSGKSVIRPSDPPPPPPINLDTHPLNSPPPLASELGTNVHDLSSVLDLEAGGNCTLGLTSTACEDHDSEQIYFSRLMPNEPLYQFYETLPSDIIAGVGDVGEGDIRHDLSGSTAADLCQQSHSSAPCQTRLSSVDMSSSVVNQSGQRSLWSDMPQVASSSLLQSVSPQVRRFQEAKFEIISSEASYLRSLNVLVSQFANSSRLRHNSQVISQEDWAAVFSNIYQIRECSEKFLQSLETCWQRSVMMHGLSEILLAAVKSEFEVFIEYCSNQAVQERTLKKLKNENTNFALVLQDLETSQVCQSLSLHSFLMLPMQRVTRLPLLTAAILSHCSDGDDHDDDSDRDSLVFGEKTTYQECLRSLNSLVTRCNEGARHRDRQDQLVKINNNLDFKQVPWLYLVTPTRWLVSQVTCTRLCWRESHDKMTWGRKVSRQRLQLLLFTDLLLVCKKKRDDKLQVLDYCQRNLLDLSAVELSSSVTSLGMGALIGGMSGMGAGGGNVKSAAWLTLIQNSSKKTCEMIIIFDNNKDRSAWLELIQPTQGAGEKIYETWDCPQVEIVHDYDPREEGDISVVAGDTANVLRKSNEGKKMFIERSSDGMKGWVPSHIVKELQSDHMRARNFKQRYQFLKALAELDMAET